ncbi:spore coat protein YsxE [Texcoconibacillus texcoconensis]|uniref:Spore coat protein YsxE n=1 Tax=Texcoconibacillus texcoconensis TaxID=1095777 RepID=A0A840QSZ9_9BACI|nr:spore coat protein YsxE [Texcoconibacillus texcoconensis]MBB5174411.1 spore coat protein YsxE [Texcoconibacillus texcoconensis]
MKDQQLSDPTGAVLFQYDLYPEAVEKFGKVRKITTKRGVFALKQTEMNSETQSWFLHVMQRLQRVHFPSFVPLIPTKYGDPFIVYQENVYYLMPWVDAVERKQLAFSPEEGIIETMAKLHGVTEKQQRFDEAALTRSYDSLVARWKRRREQMERFADQLETQTYLSPFALTFLTHVERMMRMAEEAETHLQSWLEGCKEKQRYRSVLCHGRMNRQHVLFTDQHMPYVLNFERAVLDTPVRDLAIAFRNGFQAEPWDDAEGMHWLTLYERQFVLYDEERHLLQSYLAFPEPIFRVADAYRERKGNGSELDYVYHLERRILTLSKIARLMKRISGESEPSSSKSSSNSS